MTTITYDPSRKMYTLHCVIDNKTEALTFNDKPSALAILFRTLAEFRLNYIYVWNGAKLFADFDYFAELYIKSAYDDVSPLDAFGHRPRVNKECFSTRDGDQSYYTRRYWLKTSNFITGDRHKRLHSVTLINVQNYFGGRDLDEILLTFKASNLGEALTVFNEKIQRLTGLYIFDPVTEKPKFLTLGGVSKAFYLSLKYPKLEPARRILAYQNDYPSDRKIEAKLRNANLLAGGIIYLKNTAAHCNLYKYDKVSLFPSVELDLPALSIPKKINYLNVDLSRDDIEYIFIFKTLALKRKTAMPALFPPAEGYTGENLDFIEVQNQAIFGTLYRAYLQFYDIIDSEIDCIYACRKRVDPAIKNYVERLFKAKNDAKSKPAEYFIIKLLLNNLHGKFAQNPVTLKYTTARNEQGIITRHRDGVEDNWERGHFDYIRGAYIYSMARAQMLNDLAIINETEAITAAEGHMPPYRLVDHLYYSDTDSAVLDHEITINGMVGTHLGQFKLEDRIVRFQAYAPKIYAFTVLDPEGYESSPRLKCAGAKADEILTQYYQDCEVYDVDFFEYLASPQQLYRQTTLHRTPTGAEYRTEYRPLINYGDLDEEGGEL